MSEENEEEDIFEDAIRFTAETQEKLEELSHQPDRHLELGLLLRHRAHWYTLTDKRARSTPRLSPTHKLILSVLKEDAIRELEAFEYILELKKEITRLKEKYDDNNRPPPQLASQYENQLIFSFEQRNTRIKLHFLFYVFHKVV